MIVLTLIEDFFKINF